MNGTRRVAAIFATGIIIASLAFFYACTDPFGKYNNSRDPSNSNAPQTTLSNHAVASSTTSTATGTTVFGATSTTTTIPGLNGTYRIESVSSNKTTQTDAGVGALVYNAHYSSATIMQSEPIVG